MGHSKSVNKFLEKFKSISGLESGKVYIFEVKQGLDPGVWKDLYELIKAMNDTYGTGIILVEDGLIENIKEPKEPDQDG